MKCPRCVQRIHRAAEVCPHCGFSIGQMDALHGGGDLKVRCLADTAGVMTRQDREMVQAEMARFGWRFPQLFVAVYTGHQGELSHLRQFGFWLLNRADFQDLPAEKPNDAGILLTMDPQRKTAGFVFGYLLDPYLDEAMTFECLSRAHAYWLEGRYAVGIVKAIRHLEGLLQCRHRKVRRDPESFRRRVFPREASGENGNVFRAGHIVGDVRQAEEIKEVMP